MSATSAYIEPDVAAWIRSRLISDATLLSMLPDGADSIFTSDPVQGAARPYSVIQLQGAEGVLRIVGPSVFWEGFLYLVKFVGAPEQFGKLKAMMKIAHPLLDIQHGDVHDDARIASSEYEMAFDPPADAYAGTLTKQLGGFYRVYAQEEAA